jgi:hypothetical protein
LQNFALKAPERVLQSFTILNVDFGQRSPLYSLKKEILHASSSSCRSAASTRGSLETAVENAGVRLQSPDSLLQRFSIEYLLLNHHCFASFDPDLFLDLGSP